jgi:hypothetical protein
MSRNRVSNGMHLETYGLGEHEPVNPLIPIIEEMFSNELHEHSWKKYTVEKVLELIKTKMKERGLNQSERHFLLLKKQLTKCKKMEECLEILTNNMLGRMDG